MKTELGAEQVEVEVGRDPSGANPGPVRRGPSGANPGGPFGAVPVEMPGR
jgi:hypothetical protein